MATVAKAVNSRTRVVGVENAANASTKAMLSTFSGIGGSGNTWGPLGRMPGSCAANRRFCLELLS